MKKTFFLLLLSGILASVNSQDLPEAYHDYLDKYSQGPLLNRWDSVYLMNIPEKKLPGNLRNAILPPLVDNSSQPYLRPVFSQEGPSCGQAAMVGYNFTYEINYLRGLPSDTLINQYPTHFTWNFMNGGNGWYGVSYFHSLEVLRRLGCMNAADYGGMADNGKRWINGYDHYLSAMSNRIRSFYSIHTGTEEGITALKHWLFNHMEEGQAGGVASYYANVPWNAQVLNDTTPEGGKHVMTAWYPAATHAMTIVGYNDSIRWDYNGDGQYTNHIDLNGDGISDPRDWEIGAVKFVNSHGLDAQDSGFCYMMYKCLAETFENGGVWNRAVHILDVHSDYQPLLSFKVTLKHNYRGNVKILAGISTDTSDLMPSWTTDFPVINYQGGNYYMQGNNSDESYQYLEFGLDVTDLLSYVNPGQTAKFFFIVDENDPFNLSGGEITSFSLIDHTNGMLEIPAPGTPVILANNSRTFVSVLHTMAFDKVGISTGELPAFIYQQPYGYQMEAEGGEPPYSWELSQCYRTREDTAAFPFINSNQLLPADSQDTLVPAALGFEFPFYGKTYDTVYVHIDGHLQFDEKHLPWPYVEDFDLHLRSNRIITPMTHKFFTIIPADDDGAWFEGNDSSAVFRWKLSWELNPGNTDLNFAVKIFSDGRIQFFHGPSTLEGVRWVGGISSGNQVDYVYSPFSGQDDVPAGKAIYFIPSPYPEGIEISESGWLSGIPSEEGIIYDFLIRVTDQSGISASGNFSFSSGPKIYFTLHTSQGEAINYGDTVRMDVEIFNAGLDTLRNAEIYLESQDPFLTWLNNYSFTGDIFPGETIQLYNVFSLIVSLNIPDQHDLLIDVLLNTSQKSWEKEWLLKANAPVVKLADIVVNDGDNGKLDPGETADLQIILQNAGHASIYGVNGELVSLHPQVQIIGDPVQVYGMIGKGASITRSYTLHADDSAQNGLAVNLAFWTQSLPGLHTTDTIHLRIGKIPVLIIDMDPNFHSGPVMHNMLNELDVINDYETYIPSGIDNYQALFISLGYHNSNHVLTWSEGEILEDYLLNGGRIYMEGKKTWKDDPGTPVHNRFNITHGGSPLMYDTLIGVDTTFTQGIKLLNGSVYPFSFYHLVPTGTAYPILQGSDHLQCCAVAYNAGGYKTIGTLFEFGALVDLPSSTSQSLMLKYLEFFDIDLNTTGINEVAGTNENLNLVVYPNPAGKQLTVGSGTMRRPERSEGSALNKYQEQPANGQRQTANEISSIMITDIFGRTVKKFEMISSLPFLIDISNLKNGMYILHATTLEGEVLSAKFLKASE